MTTSTSQDDSERRSPFGIQLLVDVGPNAQLAVLGDYQARFNDLLTALGRYIAVSRSNDRFSQREQRQIERATVGSFRVAASVFANPWMQMVEAMTSSPGVIAAEAFSFATVALKSLPTLLDVYVRARSAPDEIAMRRRFYRTSLGDSSDPTLRAIGQPSAIFDQQPDKEGTREQQSANRVIERLADLPPSLRRRLTIDEVPRQSIERTVDRVRGVLPDIPHAVEDFVVDTAIQTARSPGQAMPPGELPAGGHSPRLS